MRRIQELSAAPLEIELLEPFTIALGRMTRLTNVLVTVTLDDGTVGYGEAAPWPELTGETQSTVLATLHEAKPLVVGRDVSRLRPIVRDLKLNFGAQTAARAAIEMALTDALLQGVGLPMYRYFGGALESVETDLTIPIVPASDAGRLAGAVLQRGITTIKTKIGVDLDEDVDRVMAIAAAAPGAKLILDANQGYTPPEALTLLKRLERHDVFPILLEQPVHKSDLDGLKHIKERSSVPVAADEAVFDATDALELARRFAADVVNIKLAKCGGFLEALEIAAICKNANMELMIGAMLESRLGLSAAAHLAAGLGGFPYVDLDTHMLLADDPFTGGFRQERAQLILSGVESGIGVRPIGR